MTEQERKKYIQAAERRKRLREAAKGERDRESRLSFRLYVAAFLTGACFVLSMFHSETSEAFCTTLREAIARQPERIEVSVLREKAEQLLEAAMEQEEAEEYLPDLSDSP